MTQTPALEIVKPEVKLLWDADQQTVAVSWDRTQFKNLDMLLMVLEGARLQIETLRNQVIAQQRVQQFVAAQQEGQFRSKLGLS